MTRRTISTRAGTDASASGTHSTTVTVGPRLPPRLRTLLLAAVLLVPVAVGLTLWYQQWDRDRFGEPDLALPTPVDKPVRALQFDPQNPGNLLISACNFAAYKNGPEVVGGGVILWESTDKSDAELPTRNQGAFGRVPVRRSRMLRVLKKGVVGTGLFSPDGRTIVVAEETGESYRLTLFKNTGLQSPIQKTLPAYRGGIPWLGKRIPPEPAPFPLPEGGYATAVAHQPGSDEVAVGTGEGWVYRMVPDGKGGMRRPGGTAYQFAHAQHPGRGAPAVTALAYSPDGKTLATGGSDGVVFLWRLQKAIP